jgi:hypothetical protein
MHLVEESAFRVVASACLAESVFEDEKATLDDDPRLVGHCTSRAPPGFEARLEETTELQCVLRFRGHTRPIVQLPRLEDMPENHFWLADSAVLAGGAVAVCSMCHEQEPKMCRCHAALHISLNLRSAFFSALLDFAPPIVGLTVER